MPPCPMKPCCIQGGFCFNVKFCGCVPVTGFTISFWKGWNPSTTPTPPTTTPDHTATVNSLPYCWQPATGPASYGVLLRMAGWYDTEFVVSTFNTYNVYMDPTSVTATDANGAYTLTGSATNPLVGLSEPGILYKGCSTMTGTVTCANISPDIAFTGTFAYVVSFGCLSSLTDCGTGTGAPFHAQLGYSLYPLAAGGYAYVESSCSGTGISPGTCSANAEHWGANAGMTQVCGGPLDATFSFGGCTAGQSMPPPVNSVVVTL